MFLNYYNFKKLIYRSSAIRNSWYFFNLFNLQSKFKKLSFFKKSSAGRNDLGRIICRTKGRLIKKLRTPGINFTYNYNRLSFISTFQFIPFKNKLLSLVFFSNGAATHLLTSSSHRLFSYFWWIKARNIQRFLPTSFINYLGAAPKLSIVSVLSLLPKRKAQYCRSSGSFGKIINSDLNSLTVHIQLPSKTKKLFSYYSIIQLGELFGLENKKYSNTKSGYWRSFGLKPMVRGVAKNPVDHPHGGRTKAIRHQRTPWGFTTKLK